MAAVVMVVVGRERGLGVRGGHVIAATVQGGRQAMVAEGGRRLGGRVPSLQPPPHVVHHL